MDGARQTKALYWGNPNCPFCGKKAVDRKGNPKSQQWFNAGSWMTVLNVCGSGCFIPKVKGYDTADYHMGFDQMPKPEGNLVYGHD